jgi:hypothetical protein
VQFVDLRAADVGFPSGGLWFQWRQFWGASLKIKRVIGTTTTLP